ncbi:hypothetical protein HPB48_006818 [Haemaphysalis longicornis]|uniref:Uncharacterized protein n=1 Tax=Haemaphysalis longicornis TaxID=44386 RepID=A0A9J6FFY5_HAELO|nr:hypothetical protein HPB48_006818 [Haemaphysalis longicornis]
MNSTEAFEKSQLSPSSADHVNRHYKSWSDCLDNRLDIFKTSISNLDNRLDLFKTSTSANLYQFPKVGPQQEHKMSVSDPGRVYLHVFRNDSFIRGRPVVLPAATSKKGVLRDKLNGEG